MTRVTEVLVLGDVAVGNSKARTGTSATLLLGVKPRGFISAKVGFELWNHDALAPHKEEVNNALSYTSENGINSLSCDTGIVIYHIQ